MIALFLFESPIVASYPAYIRVEIGGRAMKKLIVVMLFASALIGAQTAQTPPVIPYDAVDALTLPNDLYLGEVPGVAVNAQGHIFVFHRGNNDGPAYGARASQLLEFDQNGKFLREIGKNLY